MNVHKCPDCGSEMEEGFVPDQGYVTVHQAAWHRGKAEPEISFGLFRSGVRHDKHETVPIIAYRCTTCGLLRFYAQEGDE